MFMKNLCPCIIVLMLYKVHTEETTKRIGNWFLEGESRVTQLQNSSDRHVMFKLLTQQEGLSVEGQLPTFQPLSGRGGRSLCGEIQVEHKITLSGDLYGGKKGPGLGVFPSKQVWTDPSVIP